jgi:hypothetical protein
MRFSSYLTNFFTVDLFRKIHVYVEDSPKRRPLGRAKKLTTLSLVGQGPQNLKYIAPSVFFEAEGVVKKKVTHSTKGTLNIFGKQAHSMGEAHTTNQ